MWQVTQVEGVRESMWQLKLKKKELGRRQEEKGMADAATQTDSFQQQHSSTNLSHNGAVSQSRIISPNWQPSERGGKQGERANSVLYALMQIHNA